MNTNLWAIRLKSILFTVGGIVLTSALGYFASDNFASLIQEYTGTAMWGTLVTLAITELMKHLRNKRVISVANKASLASGSETKSFNLI